jgi:hypothetical protein
MVTELATYPQFIPLTTKVLSLPVYSFSYLNHCSLDYVVNFEAQVIFSP